MQQMLGALAHHGLDLLRGNAGRMEPIHAAGADDFADVFHALTDKGRNLIETALPDVYQETSTLYEGFTEEELQVLDKLYARQLRNLNNLNNQN